MMFYGETHLAILFKKIQIKGFALGESAGVVIGFKTSSFVPRLCCTGWTTVFRVLTSSLRSLMLAAVEFSIAARFHADGFSDY